MTECQAPTLVRHSVLERALRLHPVTEGVKTWKAHFLVMLPVSIAARASIGEGGRRAGILTQGYSI